MSGLALHKGGATINAAKIHVRKAGTTLNAVAGHIRQDTLKTFFEELGVSLDAHFVSGSGNSAGTISVSSSTITATVAGGTGTLSYLWARTDSDPQAWTIANPNSASTYFITSCAANADYSATFHCTVTDGLGQTVTSSTVSAHCANDYFGGSGGPYL